MEITGLFTQGLVVGSLNVLLMFGLEYAYCQDDVKRIRERESGKELHNAGIRISIFNSICLGAITYYVTIKYCCISGPLTYVQQVISVFKFLMIENLWYYCAHWLMHRRAFYWMHRFMHLPGIFKAVHKVHHLSHNPSPWAAFSFHPLEAIIEAGILPVFDG